MERDIEIIDYINTLKTEIATNKATLDWDEAKELFNKVKEEKEKEDFCVQHFGGLHFYDVLEILKEAKPENFV